LSSAKIHPESEVSITKQDDVAVEMVFREIFGGREVLAEELMGVRKKSRKFCTQSPFL